MDTARSLAVFLCVVSACMAFPPGFIRKGFPSLSLAGGLGFKRALVPNVIVPNTIISRPAQIITNPAASIISNYAPLVSHPAPVDTRPVKVITKPQGISQPVHVISRPVKVISQPPQMISNPPYQISIQSIDSQVPEPGSVVVSNGAVVGNALPTGRGDGGIVHVGGGSDFFDGGADVDAGGVLGAGAVVSTTRQLHAVPVQGADGGQRTVFINRGPTINGGIEAERVSVTHGGLVIRRGQRVPQGSVRVISQSPSFPSSSSSVATAARRPITVVTTCNECD